MEDPAGLLPDCLVDDGGMHPIHSNPVVLRSIDDDMPSVPARPVVELCGAVVEDLPCIDRVFQDMPDRDSDKTVGPSRMCSQRVDLVGDRVTADPLIDI